MFRVIFLTQLKWSRWFVWPSTIIAFALPVLTIIGLGERPRAYAVLQGVDAFTVWFPALAAGIGLLVATSAWAEDHRGDHVYALTLPVPRWHFVLLRFSAGLAILAIPVAALWLGSLIATAGVRIPDGLRAYPHSLSLRFALATLVAFAAFFAVSSTTARTARYVLGGVGLLVALNVLLAAAGIDFSPLGLAWEFLAGPHGPLGVFTGGWVLIDV